MSSRRARRSAVAALAVLAGCGVLSAPPAEATLGGPADNSDLDAVTRRDLAAVAAAPDDVEALLAASHSLFLAADLRLQTATAARLRAMPQATLRQVLAADDELGDDVRTAIASLCTRGLECADRAAQRAERDVRARLHQALHLSLLAWANGPARSLFAGFGPKLVAAIDAAVEIDALHDDAAPLRLSGRFRGKAPWPYGDLAAADAALARAVAAAPVLVNHLFYGDVAWRRGDENTAVTQWRLAAAAPDDAATRWSGVLLRELARARLAAPRD